MIPTELEEIHQNFWDNHHSEYNMTTNEGCGKYTEAWVRYAQNNGYVKVGHLKKNAGQTQYNGHANDAFLYADGEGNLEGLYQAVDIIGAAESTDPNNPPRVNWGVDIPRYKDSDWLKEPGSSVPPNTNVVPWVPYNEQGFERCKKMIKHDYERRPQGPDYDVSVWSARFFHNHYMGPDRVPMTEDAALSRVKGELCKALRIPNDGYLGT
jgi:hypothetical protein